MSRNADPQTEYWRECLADAFCDASLSATPEQIDQIAHTVQGAHENYGMAFHRPESPYIGEIARLKKDLEDERALIFCRECNGTGRIITQGPYHGSNSQCFKCRGAGKHKP